MRQHRSTSAAALAAALVATTLLPAGPWQAVAGGSTAPRAPSLVQAGRRSVVVGATVVALAFLDLPGPPSVPTVPPAPAVVAAPPPPPPSPPPSPLGGVWAELRRCESGDDYAIDTGNGYYGAYQFSAATWHGLGFTGLPNQAGPAFQDEAAVELQGRSGWGQWPACSRRLGL
jgi:resuscitation-promoting factor RpfB